MEFKGSELEERYNKFWDKVIVILDGNIRKGLATPALFVSEDTIKEITNYVDGVNTLVKNLLRQKDTLKMTDINYVNDYIKQTIEAACIDLMVYKNELTKRGNVATVDAIGAWIEKLREVISEVAPTAKAGAGSR